MAELTLQDGSKGLDDITFSAAAAGDQIQAGTRAGGWDITVVLLVKNTDIAARTVTVEGHPAVTVGASTGNSVIPVYQQKLGSLKNITYSAVAGVTVAAVKLSTGK
jgi:hypothetical protein